MRLGPPWIGLGLALLGSAACGGSTRSTTGNGGNSAGVPTSGSGGAPSAGGPASSGGSEAEPHLLGATAEEEALLDPLFLPAAQLAAANVERLVDLGVSIGLARGYALCRCATSAEQPPPSVAQLLSGCAKDETGMLRGFSWYPSAEQGPRTNQDLARCLRDESRSSPWLEEALRCQLTRHQADGRAWLDLCSIPHTPQDSSGWPAPAIDVCPNAVELSQVLTECASVGYCADGQRISPGRCSGSRECPDASDERGCFAFVGHDMFQCGEDITEPQWVCDTDCGLEAQPPFCDEALRDRFLCADGSNVSREVVCDRNDDCADKTDELYCLR